MRYVWVVTAIVILAAALAACGAAPPRSRAASSPPASGEVLSAGQISPTDAKALLDGGKATLVDVRTAEEYAQGHIRGSTLLPLDTIAGTAAEKLPDKNATIIVYCRTGRRSAQAAAQLAQMGYAHVLDLGGIQSWPYEVGKD